MESYVLGNSVFETSEDLKKYLSMLNPCLMAKARSELAKQGIRVDGYGETLKLEIITICDQVDFKL